MSGFGKYVTMVAAAGFLLLIPARLFGNTQGASVEQLYRQQILYGRLAFSSLSLDSGQAPVQPEGGEGPKERSVTKAAVLSLLVPGAGQFYVGDKVRAIPFFLLDAAGWAAYFGFHSQGHSREGEYRAFADEHYDPRKYWAFLDTALGIPFDSALGMPSDFDPTTRAYDSRSQGFSESDVYLIVGPGFIFSHHVPTRQGEDTANFNKTFEYYESIGKYDQFFAGWDAFSNRRTYLSMRADANSSFTKSKAGIIVSLADRLVAAVDAALAARRFNQKLDRNREIEIGLRVIRYNGARMAKLSATYRF